MNLSLDNIIFSLQRGGGVSVVWIEHIKRLLRDSRFSPFFYEYNDALSNYMRREITIPESQVCKISNLFFPIKRYVNFRSHGKDPFIFHSSYYRIDNNPNARNVTTVHDFVYEKYMSGIRKKIHSSQKWKSIKEADAIICISDSTKMDLLHYLPQIDENKIHVIHNGVSDEYKQITHDQYKLNLHYGTGGFALYVGVRHVPYKNFNTAVQICKELKIPLVTVGGEPYSSEELSKLDILLGKGNYVGLRGITNSELNELYNRALVLLYPSLYEGFGIPVLEAQRCGCPVLCMKSSSIPEIVGDTDLCFGIDSTIGEMCEAVKSIKNDIYRKQEIERGLKNAERFSWDRTYRETADIYCSLL